MSSKKLAITPKTVFNMTFESHAMKNEQKNNPRESQNFASEGQEEQILKLLIG